MRERQEILAEAFRQCMETIRPVSTTRRDLRLVRQYRVSELHAHLKRLGLAQLLANLSHISAGLWEKQKASEYAGDEMVSQWQLAFIAQEAIRVRSRIPELSIPDRTAILTAMEMANGLPDRFQMLPSVSTQGNLESRLAFLVRTAYQQFWYRAATRHLLSRYLSIYQLLKTRPDSPTDLDLGKSYEDAYGLTITDFMRIGFAVYVLASVEKRPFTPDILTQTQVEPIREVLTEKNVKSFLAATALSVEGFRMELAVAGAPPPGLEQYWFNPLRRRPILETSLGYMVPCVPLLFRRITEGIYFDFLELHAGKRKEINEFTRVVGRRFEGYVGEALASHFARDVELHPEPKYRTPQGEVAGFDWTIIEERKATFIECKTSRLTKNEWMRAEISDVSGRLRKDIVESLMQFPKRIEAVRQRLGEMQNWPEIEDYEVVIVTMEPWWPEPIMKALIDAQLQGQPAAHIRYHLMWVEQLEILPCFRPKIKVFDLLRRRWEAGGSPDTRDYFNGDAKRLGLVLDNPRLRRVHDEFFKQIAPIPPVGHEKETPVN